MDRVRIAVVGAGEFGARYLSALRALGGVEVAWVCDRDLDRATRAAGPFAARATADLQQVCDDPSVDAVVVVTPEGAHRVVAEPALRAGKHVIVEKPLADLPPSKASTLGARLHSVVANRRRGFRWDEERS